MPFGASASRNSSLRAVLAVAVLNALLAFPILYSLYKHYDDAQTPMDTVEFMAMAENGPSAAPSPIRYRLLTPVLVKAMALLPGYNIAVDYTNDAAIQETFFHFLLINFFFTVATSALLFFWLQRRVPTPYAWASSLLYLFSFNVVTANLIPMSDAACHLAIIAALLCLDRAGLASRAALALIGVLGGLAKETWFLVLAPWVVLAPALGGLAPRLRLLAWMLPALAAFAAVVLWLPQGSADAGAASFVGAVGDTYLGADAHLRVKNGWDTWRVFHLDTYSRSFVFHTVLAHMPFVLALAGWGWLRGRGVRMILNRTLWIFPALLAFGIALGIDNNAGRLAFMAFPAVALFQAQVLREYAQRLGLHSTPA